MPPNHKVPSTRTPGDPPITPWDSTRPKKAKNDLKTHCQLMKSSQSGSVSKILTACRFKKTLMLGYVQKAEMHSFPNMPIMWVVALVEVGQKKDFLQKSAEKTAFLRDTNRDHLTLEGHNSLNFKDF